MQPGFELISRHGAARLGRLRTVHGDVDTPAFMPVGTLGAVKGIGPEQLEQLGAEIMLSNLYHLSVRPGIDLIESGGGLHRFNGWNRPILTDSGGYQVFSLEGLRKIDDDGVSFRNHVDGALNRFTPETVVRNQERLGVDVAMVLDECPPWPVDRSVARASLERTNRWAERASLARRRRETQLFGIVQGSVYEDLRREAAERLAELDFNGLAIGGVSVGEPLAERRRTVERTVPWLPELNPRYLMGVGTPADLVHAASHGIDMFDCVLPSRNARHGNLYTRTGVVKIKNTRYKDDFRPLDEQCSCPLCARTSRAFLHHLFRTGEVTAKVLATSHNVRFYLDFMREIRDAIGSGTLPDLARRTAAHYPDEKPVAEAG